VHIEGASRLENDRPDDHLAGVQFDQPDRCSLRQRNIVTDLEQIPPAFAYLDSSVDVNALADTSAQRA
jgi:hypothetical protein